MDQSSDLMAVETKARQFMHAWFPSYRLVDQQIDEQIPPYRFLRFFRDYNEFYNLGPKSARRIFDDKFVFSAFLAALGISVPATRWIVLKNRALSPGGQRISVSALASMLGSGRWFIKPRSESGGLGAFLLDHGTAIKAKGDFEKIDQIDLPKLLRAYESFLVQDVVVQSEDYAVFSPSSVNTVRCLTYLSRSGEVEIAAAILRMGNGRAIVDNVSSGGLYCGIDLKSHRLNSVGLNEDGTPFERHPTSNMIFSGCKVLGLDKIFSVCSLAHEALGAPMTIGWDVAMTDAGPCIIEGNTRWGTLVHSRVDPGVRGRLWALFFRDYKLSGTGFPAELPNITQNGLTTVTFRVEGKVQGVGYRTWIAELAAEKGLYGQAKNLDNGDAEIRLTGDLRSLEFAILRCMEGPPKAKVSEIKILGVDPIP
jgi:acylphosphatase